MADSLFQKLLPGSFASLSPAMRRVHDERLSKQLQGRCDVQRGHHWLVRWLAPIALLPPNAKDSPLSVLIETDKNSETWTRNFNGHRMRSHLWAHDKLLAERLGAVTLLFSLQVEQGRIEWRVAGARFLGMPLPLNWFAGACAIEQLIDGRYTFDVRATLPLVGLLVHYQGWLAE
jgi:hypothetical protein